MLIRIAAGVLVCLGLFTGMADAGQSSATFSVGITIGRPGLVKPPKSVKIYTWNAAAISVREAGFESGFRLAADANHYWFMAKRDGQHYRVAVSKTTGAIVKVLSV